MPLQPGTRLGPYEITSAIGAGGMGEVYRARDQKLQRDVAIKVLPELFSADPDRLARFEREAQSLAALNHPNIAQVFGVLENPPALAMELVEGEDSRNGSPAARSRLKTPCRSRCRSPTRSRRPTNAASSIAI